MSSDDMDHQADGNTGVREVNEHGVMDQTIGGGVCSVQK